MSTASRTTPSDPTNTNTSTSPGTSTSTSPSPSTTTLAPFSSIFQSPGGPPLILVCIAAGLLLGAFLGILLMRRVRPPVAVQRAHGLRGAAGADAQKKLGEKPTLLDVRVLPGSEKGVGGWEELLPFAALYLPSSSSPSSPSSSPAASAPRTRAELWRSRVLTRVPTRLHLPLSARRGHDPAKGQTGSGTGDAAGAGAGAPPVRQVQIAVMVSMPVPRAQTHSRFDSVSRAMAIPPVPALPSAGAGTGKEKEKETGKEKDPLSASVQVSTSAVNDSNDSNDSDSPNDPPNDPLNTHVNANNLPLTNANMNANPHANPIGKLGDDEHPVPDCCIGTLVVSYRPETESLSLPAQEAAGAPRSS